MILKELGYIPNLLLSVDSGLVTLLQVLGPEGL